MSGSVTIQFSCGTRQATGPNDHQAAYVLVRIINPDGSWGPTQNIPVVNGQPQDNQAVFTAVPAGSGYTAVVVGQTSEQTNTNPPIAVGPFDVTDDPVILIVTSAQRV